MQIITLTTDFGDVDPYSGVMKGVIHAIYPYVRIVDITHNISPQDILQASWVIESSYSYFPGGSIHVCVVDPGVGSLRKPLLIESRNYFFIGPDNGIFTSVLEKEEIKTITELTESKYWLSVISQTFHARDIFSPVAAYLAKGVSPGDFGTPLTKEGLIKLPSNSFLRTEKGCTGTVKYIDRFGNIITNIPDSIIPPKIQGKIKNIDFKGLVSSFSECEPNKFFAVKGSSGYIELFVNKGNIAKQIGAKIGDKVEVRFL
ncbi:MAG: SAM-dependent chlorinase/fluorinase [Candidatus Melainabacteria bacterium]|nr:SAM-dependent chlorinase/fluorinase [Candidatus Melainabacteria bacterium]